MQNNVKSYQMLSGSVRIELFESGRLAVSFFFFKKIHVAAVNMPCLQSEIKRLWLRFSAITKVNISFWLVVLNFYLWVLS